MGTLFYKYQGTGNDFVVLDGREWTDVPSQEWIQHICHRKWGVGSDGVVIVRPSTENDFHIDFYNPDGSQSFCGNGSRCAVAFYHDYFDSTKIDFVFSAIDGFHKAQWTDGLVSISMKDVHESMDSPWGCFMNTGSPHVMVPVENIEEMDVQAKGAEIRYDDHFQAIKGTNVNFIQRISDDWHLRTYERGVEAETLSCGTGVTASALYILEQLQMSGQIRIFTHGGILEVSADRQGPYQFTNVYLKGAVQKVFEGKWSL